MSLGRFYKLMSTRTWKFSECSRANDYREICTNILADSKELENELNKIRYSCFSKCSNIPPMWHFYAGNYSGVCLEFDVNRIKEKLGDSVEFFNIDYINLNEFSQKERNSHSDIKKYLRIKSEEWSYEKEVRMFYNGTENCDKLDLLEYINRIYLGDNCPLNMLFNKFCFNVLGHTYRSRHGVDGRIIMQEYSNSLAERLREILSENLKSHGHRNQI